MKKLVLAAAFAAFALTGCASNNLENEQVRVVEGQTLKVKVVNIPSFKVEIDPRKAVCNMTDSAGQIVEGECLQFRQPHQKNFSTMNGDIEGFTYEPGYRYMLDVRQDAVADEASGMVKPVWSLNQVISKVAEPSVIEVAE